MASNSFRLGVIGGSGIYQMNAAKVVREHAIETPFGNPSDPIIEATIASDTVMFLPRHGKGHRYLPTEVNYRANIFALKTLGVTHILSVSAVGIMQEYIKRGDLVVPDQIYDRLLVQVHSKSGEYPSHSYENARAIPQFFQPNATHDWNRGPA